MKKEQYRTKEKIAEKEKSSKKVLDIVMFWKVVLFGLTLGLTNCMV